MILHHGQMGVSLDVAGKFPAPTRPRVVCNVCVYGDLFIDRFFETYLLSQLAMHNLPWLSIHTELIYVIYTVREDVQRIRSHANFAVLSRYARVVIATAQNEDGSRQVSLPQAADAFYAVANWFLELGSDTTFLLLAPDCLWANGAFRIGFLLTRSGTTRVVLIPHFMRVVAEDILTRYARERDAATPIKVSPKDLVCLASQFRHPETELLILDNPRGCEFQGICIIEIPGEGFRARASGLHPLAIRPSGPLSSAGSTVESLIDGNHYGWDAIRVVTDRLLHVDCTPFGAPRISFRRPFQFDDFGMYHAYGALGMSQHLWKFDIALSYLRPGRRSSEKWATAGDKLLEFVSRAVLFSRIDRAEREAREGVRQLDAKLSAILDQQLEAKLSAISDQLERLSSGREKRITTRPIDIAKKIVRRLRTG
jgi:hypothetical protein